MKNEREWYYYGFIKRNIISENFCDDLKKIIDQMKQLYLLKLYFGVKHLGVRYENIEGK